MSSKARGKGCPVCGAAVRPERLRGHVSRVHGAGPQPSARSSTRRRSRQPTRLFRVPLKRLALPLLAIGLIAIVATAFLLMPKAVAYADHMFYDMGDVPQTQADHSFPLENRGTAPLDIRGASTSCGCTSVQVLTPGGDSPIFGMPGHGGPVEWQGRLEPGQVGSVRAIYDSLTHDDLYSGTRLVYVETSAGTLTYTIQVNEVR